jgi:hypothetical protein
MDFINDLGKIKCLRETHIQGDESPKQVEIASFDEHVETVPPHVAASLSSEEIKQLELWLKERENLKEKLHEATSEETVLETLPALLCEAINALDEIDGIDPDLYKDIKLRLSEFDNKLNKLQHLTDNNTLDQNEMNDSEVLKEQLKIIKKNL